MECCDATSSRMHILYICVCRRLVCHWITYPSPRQKSVNRFSMNSAVILNGKASKPQVSSVKRRLDSIFGSYDQFSEMVGMSGTDDPIIFGRSAIVDYPASSSSHQSQNSSLRHGAESTRSTSSRHSNSSSWHYHSNQHASGKGGDSSGRRPPSTTDVLQSMQGLVKDKLLTELDCSTNRNCLVKDHSPNTTSEAKEPIDCLPRKRKHSGERQVEKILEQFGRVSPLLSPVKRPTTPPLPLAVSSPAASRMAAKRGARRRDDEDSADDGESKQTRRDLGSGSASTAMAAALRPQPLIKPLAGMDPKRFGGSSTSNAVESPAEQPSDVGAVTKPAPTPTVPRLLPPPPPPAIYKDDGEAVDPGHCRLALSSLLSADVCTELREKWLRLRRKKTDADNVAANVPIEEKENARAIDVVDSMRPAYSVVIPSSYKHEWTTLSDRVQPVWYESATELTALLRKQAKFAGQRRVVVQLPDIEDADVADAVIRAVEQLAEERPDISDANRPDFLLIPPPPRLDTNFDRVVDFLLAVRASHIDANPTFRGRNLFSLGWTGSRPRDVHSCDGRWTRDGLYCIRQFLKGPLQLDALFKRKPKRTADVKTRSIASERSDY